MMLAPAYRSECSDCLQMIKERKQSVKLFAQQLKNIAKHFSEQQERQNYRVSLKMRNSNSASNELDSLYPSHQATKPPSHQAKGCHLEGVRGLFLITLIIN